MKWTQYGVCMAAVMVLAGCGRALPQAVERPAAAANAQGFIGDALLKHNIKTELRNWYQVAFHHFDTNRDGYLAGAEVTPEVRHLLEENAPVDMNHDGKSSFDEFLTICETQPESRVDWYCTDVFEGVSQYFHPLNTSERAPMTEKALEHFSTNNAARFTPRNQMPGWSWYAAPSVPASAIVAKAFAAGDKNHNGTLDNQDEYAATVFAAMDAGYVVNFSVGHYD